MTAENRILKLVPLKPSGSDAIGQCGPNDPGFGWKLSDKARRDIEAIDDNIRSAPFRLRDFLVD